MNESLTIGQLEALGDTHIECICLTCRSTTQYPFRLVRMKRPDWDLSQMSLQDLALRMKCSTCGKQDFGFKAWRHEDGPSR